MVYVVRSGIIKKSLHEDFSLLIKMCFYYKWTTIVFEGASLKDIKIFYFCSCVLLLSFPCALQRVRIVSISSIFTHKYCLTFVGPCRCQPRPEALCFQHVCPSLSHENDISGIPGGKFCNFGTNIHLDSLMKWLDFGCQRSKVTVSSENSKAPEFIRKFWQSLPRMLSAIKWWSDDVSYLKVMHNVLQ